MAETPNVVVVVADTTRVDDGYDPSVAPTLAELGDSGTRMRQAVSAAPWTLPAHASLLTGTHPSKHGAHADHELLGESLGLLPEWFRAAGYETVALSNNTWVSAESGFDRGFDEFRHMWQAVQSGNAMSELVDVTAESRVRAVGRELLSGNPLANAANVLYRLLVRDRTDDGGRRTTEWIADWLGERDGDRPFFLLANYLEPHLDYEPPRRLAERHLPADIDYEEATAVPQEPWEFLAGNLDFDDRDLRALRALYRAEITYLDDQIAAIRAALVEAGEWEDTVLVVTADHGENVGDHGLMDHQYCLYDSLVHVPLVLHGGAFTGGGDRDDLVSLVDVAPTLLDAAGIDDSQARGQFQGQSFHPSSSAPARPFVVSEYMAPQPSMDALERHVDDLPEAVYEYDRSLRAIRTTEYKLIRGSDGSRELYHLPSDPDERTDRADERPEAVRNLAADLDEWLDGFEHTDVDGSVEMDDGRRERLEQLGYLQ